MQTQKEVTELLTRYLEFIKPRPQVYQMIADVLVSVLELTPEELKELEIKVAKEFKEKLKGE